MSARSGAASGAARRAIVLVLKGVAMTVLGLAELLLQEVDLLLKIQLAVTAAVGHDLLSALSWRKRGQSPFAGTALRVLRTNGDCPLFCGRREARGGRSGQWPVLSG